MWPLCDVFKIGRKLEPLPQGEVCRRIDQDPEARVVILSAAGKMFTSGIDLSDLTKLAGVVFGEQDIARKSLALHSKVRVF